MFQLGQLIQTLQTQLEAKGKELIEFREKHNIRVRGEEEAGDATKADAAAKQPKQSGSGVLVDSKESS